MSKPKTTKTLGPLHFEDFEPHRFESLVRNLLYDFRDWQIVEPTGQGGNDDGFDIRAWERTDEVRNEDETTENKMEEEGIHPMEGNLWMIQCKRVKELGPSKINTIIKTVSKKNPPYGFILVAPINFTKKSYDIFRQKLRQKGVMEFYLWGKVELEDMLYLPKNDRILFAFFGISLNIKRKTKASEIKFFLNNKKKLFQIFNGQEQNNFRESVLIRDFNDEKYPYTGEYKDFDKKPRWKEYIAFAYHPLGLWVHISEHYAYMDIKKKEFSFIKELDLLQRESNSYKRNIKEDDLREKIEDYWSHLPLKNQARLKINGFVFYKDMLVIDDKGDVLYKFPHIFIDYKMHKRIFGGYRYLLGQGNGDEEQSIDVAEEKYKKIDIFPKKFSKPKLGRIYKDKFVDWDEETIRVFEYRYPYLGRIYDVSDKYKFLQVKDVIAVKKIKKDYEKNTKDRFYLEITYKYSIQVGQFLDENGASFRDAIERQIGRKVVNKENLNILEVKEIYDYKVEKRDKFPFE